MGQHVGSLSIVVLVRSLLPLLALLLCVSSVASAHRPFIAGSAASQPESAPRIADPSVSRVIYYELSSRSPVQWFVIENDRPREVPVMLGVPAGTSLESANPLIILFGPGLDGRVEEVEIRLPVEPPQGDEVGALLLSGAYKPERFYEPVTGTESQILLDASVRFPSAGIYYGAVLEADGRKGKVWVGLGRREGFTWRDIGRLPGWIREVRDFHEVPGWPRWVWIGAVGLVAVVAAGVAWAMRRQ